MRGPRFWQAPTYMLSNTVNIAPNIGILCPLLAFMGTRHAQGTERYTQAKIPMHIK